jgi:6-pyruvoyltetrahydropterin/6-carboxytetrahydropterin synthase
VRICVEGELDPQLGWVIDFSDIKKAYLPIREQLDHYYLNDIKGLENPTAENIARWIWVRLRPRLPILSKIEIGETCTSGCVYRGD